MEYRDGEKITRYTYDNRGNRTGIEATFSPASDGYGKKLGIEEIILAIFEKIQNSETSITPSGNKENSGVSPNRGKVHKKAKKLSLLSKKVASLPGSKALYRLMVAEAGNGNGNGNVNGNGNDNGQGNGNENGNGNGNGQGNGNENGYGNGDGQGNGNENGNGNGNGQGNGNENGNGNGNSNGHHKNDNNGNNSEVNGKENGKGADHGNGQAKDKGKEKDKKLIEKAKGKINKKNGLKNALARGKGLKLGIYKQLELELPPELPPEEIPDMTGIAENVVEIVNELVNGEETKGDKLGLKKTVMEVLQGATVEGSVLTYNELNQLILRQNLITGEDYEYAYDGKGNLTGDGQKTYEYDAENRLEKITGVKGKTVTFEYDWKGRRTSKTEGDETTRYHYLGDNNLVVKEDGENEITYTYDQNGQPLSMTLDGSIYYYHYNAHQDVTAITDSSGNLAVSYQYDPWGRLMAKQANNEKVAEANPYLYGGYHYDRKTGLYFLQARYYDPVQWSGIILVKSENS